MSGSFRFVALPSERFAPLFDLSNTELEATGARRRVVDRKPGFPCRVSLADADVGETVLLTPFLHHEVSSPYRVSGPIFVRRGARTATPTPAVGEVPALFRHCLLSVRAYDEAALMVASDVVDGSTLEAVLRRLLSDESVRYLHVHNARPGCYNCRIERA